MFHLRKIYAEKQPLRIQQNLGPRSQMCVCACMCVCVHVCVCVCDRQKDRWHVTVCEGGLIIPINKKYLMSHLLIGRIDDGTHVQCGDVSGVHRHFEPPVRHKLFAIDSCLPSALWG